MSTSIEFRFPTLPESVNKLYFNRGGRRVLSSKGEKYKNSFVSAKGGASARDLMDFEVDVHTVFQLEIWFFLRRERLYTKYGKDKRVKYPHQNIDVSNMVKLAEDAISMLLNISDRCNFTVICHKRVADEGDEGVVARLQHLDLENDPHAID